MGTGGSKEKENKQTTTTTKTSPVRTSTTKNENDNRNSSLQKQKSVNEIQYPNNNRTQFDNNQTFQNNNIDKSSPSSQRNKRGDVDDVLNLDSEWTSKNTRKDVYPVSSDRGRREDDRNAYNRQINNTVTEEYPETYAQRNAREQYKRHDLLRQKTIYRDPKDWEPEEKKPPEEEQNEAGEFDVSKFRAANKTAPPQRRDIFDMTPDPYTSRHGYDDMHDPDSYYDQNRQTVPRQTPVYDKTEEDLMADIEKIF
ncbi:probable WRKY transcription factor protein 1 isoform X2 [Argopecten irradians]|uniref:probable WRKY transcription factor protein 1 isoform X2 n=1 Tax=Argopecten irradians TaxID=31199 RepID=UPI00371E3FED